MKFQGKVAIVVGAGSGIGKAAAKMFGREGAKVVVADIDQESAERVAADINSSGGEAAAFRVDMTKVEETEAMAQFALEKFGQIDILVNVAGGSVGRYIRERLGPFSKQSKEEWDRIIDINLNGARNCTRAVINHMMERRSGKIISIASMAGVIGVANGVDYSAAKAGIIGFTKALAQEMAPYNIQVNCISPGGVYSERMQWAIERQKREGGRVFDPSQMATPEEIAEIIALLASDTLKSLSGENILVHRGRPAPA